MKISYTVIAIPKDKRKRKKVYRCVYDIGHYYSRNTSDDAESMRLLIGDQVGDKHTERKYIDLMKYDVLIHLNDGSEGEKI